MEAMLLLNFQPRNLATSQTTISSWRTAKRTSFCPTRRKADRPKARRESREHFIICFIFCKFYFKKTSFLTLFIQNFHFICLSSGQYPNFPRTKISIRLLKSPSPGRFRSPILMTAGCPRSPLEK